MKLEWKGAEIMEALNKYFGINTPKKTAVYKWIVEKGEKIWKMSLALEFQQHQRKTKTLRLLEIS